MPPRKRRANGVVALRADGAGSIISHPQHTRSNQPSESETASLRRDAELILAQMALKPAESPCRRTTHRHCRPDFRPAHHANGQDRAAVPTGTQGFRWLTDA